MLGSFRAFSTDKVKQKTPLREKRLFSNSHRSNHNSFYLNLNQSLHSGSKLKRYKQSAKQYRNSKRIIAIKDIINDYFKQDRLDHYIMPALPKNIMTSVACNHKDNERKKSKQHYKNQKEELSKSVITTSQKCSELPQTVLNTSYSFRWNHNKVGYLPPINQTAEDIEEPKFTDAHSSFYSSFHYNSSTQELLYRSSSDFSSYINPQTPSAQETRILKFQNEMFKVFLLCKKGRSVSRIKSFKQYGLPVMQRELKIKQFDLPLIWHESKCSSSTFQSTLQIPIKDLLSKIQFDQMSPHILRIRPKVLYKRLSANGFQQLRVLLRGFCQDLKKVKGKVINNKITPENIFLTKDYRLCLAEWGYSSFREAFNIQSSSFQSRVQPILRGEKEWFVSLEYLAPEIISELLGNSTQDIWSCASSPDIWSLGLVVFQMMTLIPIWSTTKCLVVGRPKDCSCLNNHQKYGLLGIPGRDLAKIYKKQMEIQKQMTREMANWGQAERALGKLVIRMVEPNLEQRINLQQLIAQL